MFSISEHKGSNDDKCICGLIKFVDIGAQLIAQGIAKLNRQISDAPFDFFILSNGPHNNNFLSSCLPVLQKSHGLGAIISWDEPNQLVFKKSAFEKLGGFPVVQSASQIIDLFFEASDIKRCFSTLEIGRRRIVAPVQAREPVTEIKDFESLGINYTLASDTKKAVEIMTTDVALDDVSIINLIQQAVDNINGQKFADSVSILKQVLKVRIDIPPVYFLCALAEAQQGLFTDAMKSLMFLMERDPQHQQGKQLLNEIRQIINPKPAL